MISTRGRYALRVMLDLAENDNGSYIPLKDIAARQEISKKYLEIIAKELVSGGLLTGASGKGGGYRLVRRPDEYSVGEIIELMEGSLSSVACLADKKYKCPRKKICKTLSMWKEYDDLVHDFFNKKKLSDLLTQEKEK
ncbi:MAG: Rrf2 family transcriptional regulator [Lachnospiraceae bacterium]|nr:Rrf2 family transcriptional regulator [Lachnospiraceae bacterium]